MKKFWGYFGWLLCFAANGSVLFIFGLLSNNATGPPKYFYLATWIGAGFPVLLSMYFVSREKFTAGALVTFLIVPLVLLILFALHC